MILMNQRICVAKETVQLDGSVVLDNLITGVFLNGCSATEKMIAETTVMNYPKTVLNVIQIQTSNAPTIDVFQSKYFLTIMKPIHFLFTHLFSGNGHATFPMIVVMEAMKPRPFAKEAIANALSLNFTAVTESVYHQDGVVTTKTIVATTAMNRTVRVTNAKMELSNALLDIVLLHTSVVMVTKIVGICLMRLDVPRVIQEDDIVQNLDSNVTTIFASHHQTCVMEPMIAEMDQMKTQKFVPILTVIL